jgi:aspartyl-tRNA(Asn)/glutamyl-tRNA(Gln) amidotransferase subunit B
MKDNSYVMKAGAKSTRGWDDAKLETTQQREKEDAHDYRYFPDPDLVPLTVSGEQVEQIRATLPELPLAREHRYINELGLKVKDARSLIESPGTSVLFDQTVAAGADPQRAAAVLRNYGAKLANEKGCEISELGITPQHVADIIALTDSSKISSNAAADLFNFACESDDSAEQLAEKHGLIQVSDTGELDGFIDQVLADSKNEKTINDIKEGKDKAIGALMGQIMKLSRGKANPKLVTEMIKQKLQG